MNLKKQVSLVVVMLLVLMVAGCASATANAKNYPTLKQTQTNVSWPMTRYRNAIMAFTPVTQEAQDRVAAAYTEYQTAFDAALKAAGGNYDASTPENVKALASEVVRVVETIPY